MRLTKNEVSLKHTYIHTYKQTKQILKKTNKPFLNINYHIESTFLALQNSNHNKHKENQKMSYQFLEK